MFALCGFANKGLISDSLVFSAPFYEIPKAPKEPSGMQKLFYKAPDPKLGQKYQEVAFMRALV